jgi:hypothetical protein
VGVAALEFEFVAFSLGFVVESMVDVSLNACASGFHDVSRSDPYALTQTLNDKRTKI